MNHPVPEKYLKSMACPSCASRRLLLTKEKIFICQACLKGFKMVGDVPDFRLENAISFKEKLQTKKKHGQQALLTITLGHNKHQTTDVRLGHCVVLGRKIPLNQDIDKTIVRKLSEEGPSFISLESSNQQIVSRFLSKGIQRSPKDKEFLLRRQKKLLGEYIRDPDFLLTEPSVSRSHAVIFQNPDGVHVLDLFSKNGTYVNGCEIESSKLRDNDVISLGTASMRIRLE